MRVSVAELQALLEEVLVKHGVTAANAGVVAATIVAAERDGSRSHGLQRMAGYLSSLKSGWVDGKAEPVIEEAAPGLLKVDARNGFAQIALAKASGPLRAMAERQGTAAMATANSHHSRHYGPMWSPLPLTGTSYFR